MNDFVEATTVDMIPSGRGTVVVIAEKDVALFNVEGTFYAIDDTCPHAGGSLGTSKLDDKIVTCRGHGMKFDVTTGCFAGTSDFAVKSYEVKVIDGKIFVKV